MFNKRIVSIVLQSIFVLTIAAAVASAQPYKNSYANSATGSEDQPHCGSQKNPCKHIKDAINNTTAGGTLTLLYADPADTDTANACHMPYENVMITRAITIQAKKGLPAKPCFIPGISGLDIEANVDVHLKGLRFVGSTGSSIAITTNKGARLSIENCYFFKIVHGVTIDVGSLKIRNSTFNDIAKAILTHDPRGQQQSVSVKGTLFKTIGDAALYVQKDTSANGTNIDIEVKEKSAATPPGKIRY